MILSEDGSGQLFTVQYRRSDGHGVTLEDKVFFNAANRDATHIGAEVEQLTLAFTENDVTVTGLELHNDFVLNGNRMLLVGLLTACVYLLIALRDVIGRRLELGFLIVALAAGLYMSLGMPANVSLCFDDQIHFDRVAKLSHGKETEISSAEQSMAMMAWSTVRNGSFTHAADTLADEVLLRDLLNRPESNAVVYDETLQYQFSDTGYMTQTMGFALARALGLPFHVQFLMGRMFNMLTYVGLCYLAIKTLKRFKTVMAVVALTPTPMFLSANYSYDPTINGLCFLGLALVMDAIMDRDTRLTWQRGVSILLCLTIGSLTKVVYVPLLLLVLLLPRSKFASNGQRIWYKAFALFLMVLPVLSMMSSVSGGAVALQDDRAPNSSSAEQIAFLLAHPITYLGYFFNYLWKYFAVYFEDSARIQLAYTGHLPDTLAHLGMWLLLFCAFTDNDPLTNQKLNWKQRLTMFLVAGLVVGMVFTTMYVAWSAVGVEDFGGVQGRYLLPMLPLMYMVFSPEGIKNRMNKTGWHLTFCLLNLVQLGLICVQLCTTYFQ